MCLLYTALGGCDGFVFFYAYARENITWNAFVRSFVRSRAHKYTNAKQSRKCKKKEWCDANDSRRSSNLEKYLPRSSWDGTNGEIVRAITMVWEIEWFGVWWHSFLDFALDSTVLEAMEQSISCVCRRFAHVLFLSLVCCIYIYKFIEIDFHVFVHLTFGRWAIVVFYIKYYTTTFENGHFEPSRMLREHSIHITDAPNSTKQYTTHEENRKW